MKEKEYVYNVEEYSQDVKIYEVTSNVKLTEYEVQQIYIEVDNDVQKYIDWEDERFTDDEIKNEVKVSVEFVGTEYGDDCQVDIMGEFEEI